MFVLWFNDSNWVVCDKWWVRSNFIFTLRYTLENGLSSCLVTSYNDNFCSVIGFSNLCTSQTESCQRGFAGESESAQTFAEITPDAHQESFFFFCLSGSWHQKAIWSLQNSTWHFTEWPLQSLPLSTQQKLYVCVDSLHAYTRLMRQICQMSTF